VRILTQVDAPTIFRIAGFDTKKSQWISGLNNIFYMVSSGIFYMLRNMLMMWSSQRSSVCLHWTALADAGHSTGVLSDRELPCF
jgi:hypothetical protein